MRTFIEVWNTPDESARQGGECARIENSTKRATVRRERVAVCSIGTVSQRFDMFVENRCAISAMRSKKIRDASHRPRAPSMPARLVSSKTSRLRARPQPRPCDKIVKVQTNGRPDGAPRFGIF